MVLDFGIRLGNGSSSVRRHSVLVECGRVRDRMFEAEPVE